jgi:hypothetical protein
VMQTASVYATRWFTRALSVVGSSFFAPVTRTGSAEKL